MSGAAEGRQRMQLGGIGSEHGAAMHQVTACAHDHSHVNQEGGATASAARTAAQLQQTDTQQDGQFSLAAWLDRTLGSGKRMLKGFWNGSEGISAGQAGDKTGSAQIMAQIYDSNSADNSGRDAAARDSRQQDIPQAIHTPQIAAAATAVNPETMLHNAEAAGVGDPGIRQENMWQKIRVKFKDITGQLAGHLPGSFFRFQPENSFHAKQEQPREDLRKRSKVRRDEAKLDCFRTDDSYLLDSYDRRGEYSKLSTKK